MEESLRRALVDLGDRLDLFDERLRQFVALVEAERADRISHVADAIAADRQQRRRWAAVWVGLIVMALSVLGWAVVDNRAANEDRCAADAQNRIGNRRVASVVVEEVLDYYNVPAAEKAEVVGEVEDRTADEFAEVHC